MTWKRTDLVRATSRRSNQGKIEMLTARQKSGDLADPRKFLWKTVPSERKDDERPEREADAQPLDDITIHESTRLGGQSGMDTSRVVHSSLGGQCWR
jgi:hypothetical protein